MRHPICTKCEAYAARISRKLMYCRTHWQEYCSVERFNPNVCELINRQARFYFRTLGTTIEELDIDYVIRLAEEANLFVAYHKYDGHKRLTVSKNKELFSDEFMRRINSSLEPSHTQRYIDLTENARANRPTIYISSDEDEDDDEYDEDFIDDTEYPVYYY